MAEVACRTRWLAGLAILVCLWAATAARAEPLVMFEIGRPDGSPEGFGLSDRSYHPFAEVYRKPVVFDAATDKPAAWPFIHPSTHDTWAGGKPHPFTVNFTATANKGSVYLHIGLVDVFTPPLMIVSANGREIARRRLVRGSGSAQVAFEPMTEGKPSVVTFDLPAGVLKDGANTIAITLDDGSWLIYDYVRLSAGKTPPKLQAPPSPELLKDLLAGPMHNADEIVFACRQLAPDGHWYANFGYFAEGRHRKTYAAGGRLCKLNVRTGEMTVLLDDPDGAVRDPQVHYDGERMVFSYRRGGTDPYHLYEINTDGTGLRQLTDGDYDDIEPTYMPDGSIIFCSSRCKRWVNCWLTQVAVLYRCDADGRNIRQLSSNNEHENTPWPLPDGRVLYQRWEYTDRSQVHYHHLWTANPDGTAQMIYYGNMHPGIVMIDAKPIPQTDKVLSIFSPGHGKREHEGAVTIVTPKTGPDDKGAARRITRTDNWRDPWPFSENLIMAAQGSRLVLMNGNGQTQDVYRLPAEWERAGVQLHEPSPVMARTRERVIPDRIHNGEGTGRLILADVYRGRNMDGVERGSITNLLVLETLPKPINYTGGMDPLSYGGTFTLQRIVGTVPVETDGSAYMEVPADRGLFFVALDAQDRPVKRMQSFLTVKPGEVTSCVGCHEPRTQTPAHASQGALLAVLNGPYGIEPIAGVPDVFDFPRDIQPILDRHCLKCHDYDKRKGGVILTGDHGPMFSHSYATLTIRKQVADGRNRPVSNYAPYTLGSAASPLMHKIDKGHNGVKLTDREKQFVRLWIDSAAAYPGTYAALGNGMIGGYAENNQNHTDFDWPVTKQAAETIRTRCDSCHTENRRLPRALSDENGLSFWDPNWDDPRLRFSRHLMFNLTRPEKSLVLLAPLAKEAGGYGMCQVAAADGTARPVFETTADPGYQALLAMCSDGKDYLRKIRRFDMPGFVPPGPYVREMKRYGVLPAGLVPDAELDVYATDQAYWRSLWHEPDLLQ
ncbi:MAG: PD40 domain-containing protein [Phycisphaerae bacterium]|nr:PD40 domain-containing protein [Phycisphaerae bacterium]